MPRKVDPDEVIARTTELYAIEVLGEETAAFRAPEARPRLSRQVKSLAIALVEAINAAAEK